MKILAQRKYLDGKTKFFEIYSGNVENISMSTNRIFKPKIQIPDFETDVIRLEMVPSGVWTEIESVKISGYILQNDEELKKEMFKGTLDLQKQVYHLPYIFSSFSPFDYNSKNETLTFAKINPQQDSHVTLFF